MHPLIDILARSFVSTWHLPLCQWRCSAGPTHWKLLEICCRWETWQCNNLIAIADNDDENLFPDLWNKNAKIYIALPAAALNFHPPGGTDICCDCMYGMCVRCYALAQQFNGCFLDEPVLANCPVIFPSRWMLHTGCWSYNSPNNIKTPTSATGKLLCWPYPFLI